ncbi:MAG TPA: YajQ family cyclic di-GMP-binding protein [Chloroflexota bacterium]|nr:YajQ family cyclic di-GMP-binding protein [Chloroflexota bacterium]
MAGESSFDVVSEFDRQELVNAIDQAMREIHTRYDLKDSGATIVLEKTEIELKSPDTMTNNAVRDILQSKMIGRKLSLKIIKFDEPVESLGGSVRQVGTLQMGLSQELAKEISKLLRDNFAKVKSQIQGDAIRVTSKSRDDLQAVQAALRAKEYPVPLQFTNYR